MANEKPRSINTTCPECHRKMLMRIITATPQHCPVCKQLYHNPLSSALADTHPNPSTNLKK